MPSLHLLLLPLLSLSLSLSLAQLFPPLSIDCSRFPLSFCCTSRVRSLCQAHCANVQCESDSFQEMFSSDLDNRNTAAKDGSARGKGRGRGGNEERRERERGGTVAWSKKPTDEDVDSQIFSELESLPPISPPPPPSIPDQLVPERQTTQEPSAGGFPTLIPFQPNVDDSSSLKDKDSAWTTPPITTTTRRSKSGRHRTTPDPRIIRPPESLVVIGDYDIEEVEPIVEPATTVAPSASFVSNTGGVSSIAREDLLRETQTSRVLPDQKAIHSSAARSIDNFNSAPQQKKLKCQMYFGRLVCRSLVNRTAQLKREFVTNRIVLPILARKRNPFKTKKRKGTTRNGPSWTVSLLKSQSREAEVGKVPNFAVDGDAGKLSSRQKIASGIESIIQSFSLQQTGNTNMRERSRGTEFEGTAHKGDFGELEVMSGSAIVIRTTAPPGISFTAPPVLPALPFRPPPPPVALPSPPSIPPPPPTPSQQKCGIAPDFTPCVSSQQASHALLDCCRRKNLPPGCLPLCRYDITQAEVRSALDKGQCGLFNVAPFLECAAQGKDNTQCCQYKGVAKKSGPQCEQFCRPSSGLSVLGLQHIVCGNAIGEMLQCHHSGIRL